MKSPQKGQNTDTYNVERLQTTSRIQSHVLNPRSRGSLLSRNGRDHDTLMLDMPSRNLLIYAPLCCRKPYLCAIVRVSIGLWVEELGFQTEVLMLWQQ